MIISASLSSVSLLASTSLTSSTQQSTMNSQQQAQRVPVYVRNFYRDETRPVKIFDQHFGNGVFADDFTYGLPLAPTFRNQRSVPYGRRETGLSELRVEKDRFVVLVDLQHFTPEEVSVRTSDGYLCIEGNHQEREDEHGLVQRRFARKYFLPEHLEVDQLNAYFSTDGVLFVSGPRQSNDNQTRIVERIIPVSQTGQPSTNQQQQTQYSKKK